MGELPDIVEAALNHVSIRSALAATYNRSRYRPQVAAALQRLADALDGIKEGAGEVVPIRLSKFCGQRSGASRCWGCRRRMTWRWRGGRGWRRPGRALRGLEMRPCAELHNLCAVPVTGITGEACCQQPASWTGPWRWRGGSPRREGDTGVPSDHDAASAPTRHICGACRDRHRREASP